MKTTFFTPGWTCDNHPDSVEEILSRGHEIGAHSYAHEKMTDLTAEKEADVWERSMAALEKVGVKAGGLPRPLLDVRRPQHQPHEAPWLQVQQ